MQNDPAGDSPARRAPRALLDADRTRPALWRWMAFWTLVLVVLSLWVPVVPSESPAPPATVTPFTTGNLLLLLVTVGLAVLVVPATARIRLVIAAGLLGATCLAWLLDEWMRRMLGPPFLLPGA